MNGYTQTIPIRHIFTSAEIEQMGRDLAREEIIFKETSAEFAEVKAGFTKRLTASRDIIAELSTNIESGEVTKEIECDVQMHAPKKNKKTCSPVDGGESFVLDMQDDDFAVLT
jgi:hypothetical protein